MVVARSVEHMDKMGVHSSSRQKVGVIGLKKLKQSDETHTYDHHRTNTRERALDSDETAKPLGFAPAIWLDRLRCDKTIFVFS